MPAGARRARFSFAMPTCTGESDTPVTSQPAIASLMDVPPTPQPTSSTLAPAGSFAARIISSTSATCAASFEMPSWPGRHRPW